MKEDSRRVLSDLNAQNPSFWEEWRIDGTIEEGEIVDAGETKIQALHMLGHTSGHLAFFFPDEGLLFCGDICLTQVGPWYADASTPIDCLISSINRIIDMKPDRVVSGHNKEVLSAEVIRDVFEEYRGRIYKRDERILKTIGKRPQTIDELAEKKLIYPAHPTDFVLYWEKAMIAKHLKRLIKKGVAATDGQGVYYAS